MSALCQKRTFCAAAKTSLFNHLVSGVEHRLRYGQVKRFGGFAIDSELGFRGLLERQVGWLLAFQNTTSVDADNAIGVGKIRSVTHQPAGRDKLGQSMDRRHTKACREGSEVIELTVEVWICPDSGTWCDRVYKLDLFSNETVGHADYARNIAAGLVRSVDKPYPDRIGP